jgi:lauroyl/myristoyl acyltransferase
MEWTFPLEVRMSAVERWRRPKRRRKMVRLLALFAPPGTSRRELERQVILSRMIRRVGARTYAPVFKRSRDWLVHALQPEGLDHLEQARRAGGAIVMGAHAGFASWVAPVLHELGYPLRLTQRKRIAPEKVILFRWHGLTSQVLSYPEDADGGGHLKALHNLVRAGAWVQHVGDYPDCKNGLEGTYLGFKVRCVRAPWILARLSERPVIPVLMLMNRSLSPRLIIREPIWVAQSGDATDAMTVALQAYLDFAAAHVSQMPWNLNLTHQANLIGRAMLTRALQEDAA